jgi:hypothetical protein
MIEVSQVFVLKWEENWETAKRMAFGCTKSGDMTSPFSIGDKRRAIEYFLDAMKRELVEVLVPEVIPNAKISFDKSHLGLDTESPT